MAERKLSKEDAFLLQEHQEIWEFVKKLTDLEHSWLKFYYAIIAASATAIAILYKYLILDGNAEESLFRISITAILFILSIVSIIMLRNFLVLRERSVEYRNFLNIIRAWFLEKYTPTAFSQFLERKKSKDLHWNYLPRTPEQKFIKKGVETNGIYLIIIIMSFILTAFLASVERQRIWDRSGL
jgi:hypothetical protein